MNDNLKKSYIFSAVNTATRRVLVSKLVKQFGGKTIQGSLKNHGLSCDL